MPMEKPLRDGKDPDNMPRHHRPKGDRQPREPRQDATEHHENIAHDEALEAVVDKAEIEMLTSFRTRHDQMTGDMPHEIPKIDKHSSVTNKAKELR